MFRVGCFFLLCGIARFHGGLHIHEKGAYRVALWSFIVEVIFHASEVYRGTILLKDTAHVFVICGVAILFQTLLYNSILYPTDKKK
jgi:hypothetical protein